MRDFLVCVVFLMALGVEAPGARSVAILAQLRRRASRVEAPGARSVAILAQVRRRASRAHGSHGSRIAGWFADPGVLLKDSGVL